MSNNIFADRPSIWSMTSNNLSASEIFILSCSPSPKYPKSHIHIRHSFVIIDIDDLDATFRHRLFRIIVASDRFGAFFR